jgi:hypothetical protein
MISAVKRVELGSGRMLYIQGVVIKFPERFYYANLREPCDLVIVKICLCMFQLAPVTISTHQH